MNPRNKYYINKTIESKNNIPKYYNSNTAIQNGSSKNIIINSNINLYHNKKNSNIVKKDNNLVNHSLVYIQCNKKTLSQAPLSKSYQDLINFSNKNKNIVISSKKKMNIDHKLSNLEFENKKELRNKIEEKNKNVTQLRNNRNYLKEQFQEKLGDFIKKIKKDIKHKIYDKSQKRNLHYIYKYYENLKKNIPQNLDTNLGKIKNEIKEKKIENNLLKVKNKNNKEKLKDIINQKNLVRSKKEIIHNVTKEKINNKIQKIKIENEKIKKEMDNLEKWKKKVLYDLKMGYETKGRQKMQKEALKLAINLHNPNNINENVLAKNSHFILENLEQKKKNKEEHVYYQLMDKRNKLRQELDMLRYTK